MQTIPQSNFSYGGPLQRFGNQSLTVPPFTSAAPLAGPLYDKDGRMVHQMTKDEGLKTFFGEPRYSFRENPENYNEQENLDLPDAYWGSNVRMTQLLISEITREELWPITYMFPWRKSDHMTLEWDIWNFNDSLLGRVPEESVPRLVTSNRSAGSTNMIRHGIAFLMEHGFYNTRMGHQHFVMQLQQIKNATVETAAWGALWQAYNHERYHDPNDVWRSSSERSIHEIDELIRRETQQFGAFHKGPRSPNQVLSELEQILTQRNHAPGDMFILPAGSKAYLEDKFAAMPFALTGFRMGENPNPLNTNGRLFFESRGFRQGSHMPDEDPADRLQTIGSFGILNDVACEDVKGKDFHIGMMDRYIWNENADDFSHMAYKSTFKYTGLYKDWDSSDNPDLSDEIGVPFYGDSETFGEYYKKIGALDYCIDTIQGLRTKDQREFVQLAEKYSISNNIDFGAEGRGGRGGGRAIEDLSLHNASHAEYRRSANAAARAKPHVAASTSSSTAVLQQAANYILPEEQTQFKTLLNYLLDIDRQYGTQLVARGLHEFFTQLQRNKNNNEKTNVRSVFIFISSWLANIDCDQALKNSLRSNFKLTASELYCKQKGFTTAWPSEDQLVDAENSSSHWSIDGSSDHRLIIDLKLNRDHRLDLPSKVFTLTSNNIVLFKLDDEEVKQLENKQGLLEIVSGNKDRVAADPIRVGRLQYSVALSALAHLIQNYYHNSKHNKEDESKQQKALFKHIKSVVTLKHSSTKRANGMQAIATEIREEEKLGLLKCQKQVEELINACSLFLHEIYMSTREDSWDYYLNLVIDQFIVLDNMNDEFDARTGAAFTPYTNRLNNIVRQSTEDSQELTPEFYARAQEIAWNLLQKKDVKLAAENKQIARNAIRAYKGAFTELFVAYCVKGWATANSEVEETSSWDKAIENAIKLYTTSTTSFAANTAVNMYLNAIFDRIKDSLSLDNTPPDVEKLAQPAYIDNLLKDRDNQVKKLIQSAKSTLKIAKSQEELAKLTDSTQFYRPDQQLREERRRLINSAINDFTDWQRQSEWNGALSTLRTWDSDKVLDEVDYLSLAIWYHSGQQSMPSNLIQSVLDHIDRYRTDSKYNFVDAILNIPFMFGNTTADAVIADITPLLRDKNPITQHLVSINWQEAVRKYAERWSNFTVPNETEEKKYEKRHPEPEKETEDEVMALSLGGGHAFQLTDQQLIDLLNVIPVRCGAYIKWCMRRHVYPPVGVILWRPHERWLMSSAIHMNGRGRAGWTFFHNADFQLGDNTAQKMHMGNFTIYLKSAIIQNKYLAYADNIMCKAYLGGAGCSLWDPLNVDDLRDYHDGNLYNDIFAVAVPVNYRPDSWYLDITGRYHPSLNANRSAELATLYSSADIYAAHWGWTAPLKDPTNMRYKDSYPAKYNTLCLQMMEMMYSSKKGDFSRIKINRGHWGPDIYAGCAAAHIGKGGGGYLLPTNYSGTNTISLVR